MNKTVILIRVSTADQNPHRQLSELTDFATANGLEVVEVITETISGAKKNSERKAVQQVLKLARSKQINKLLIHEVSRLGRMTSEVLVTLQELHSLKVSVVVKNYNLETLRPDGTEDPMAQFLFTILTDIGRMERITLIERVKSGMAEARAKGKHLGRPKGTTRDIVKQHPKIVKYLEAGQSIRETAKLAGVGISTVQRVKKQLEYMPLPHPQ